MVCFLCPAPHPKHAPEGRACLLNTPTDLMILNPVMVPLSSNSSPNTLSGLKVSTPYMPLSNLPMQIIIHLTITAASTPSSGPLYEVLYASELSPATLTLQPMETRFTESGTLLQTSKLWCQDPNPGVCIPGLQLQGLLAPH